MRKIEKKGVSPVVATTLLVLLTLVLAIIIFMWARGFVKEQLEKNGQSAEYMCAQLKFEANFQKTGNVGEMSKMPGVLQVVNRGDIPIYGFDIKQVDGGTIIRTPFLFGQGLAPGETIPGKNILLLGSADKLEMYPILLAAVKNQKLNKQYTCLNNAVRINVN